MLVTEIRYATVWPHGLSWRCSNSSGKTLEGHKIAGIFHHSFSDGKSYWEHWSLHLEEIIFIPIFILRGGRFPVIGTLCRRHWGIELPTKSHSAAERTTETNENQCQIKPIFPFSVRKEGELLLRKNIKGKKPVLFFWMFQDQQREALELTEVLTGQQQCGRKLTTWDISSPPKKCAKYCLFDNKEMI